MFGRKERADAQALIDALDRSQAVIEFNVDGTIITANRNFLDAVGYSLEEIRGKHHSMFVDASERDTVEYREFWAALGRGELRSAEFRRVAKGGREIWIQASYNPIVDKQGRPFKVVKFATDVTRAKARNLDAAGKLAAINRTQAVIEFELDGTIVTANENFLGALGYSLADIRGQHHRMFVAPDERDGSAYREFWSRLTRGEYQSGEYKRIGNGGREVWILASYNPILDDQGKPIKVVKFATDITEQRLKAADFAGQISAIGKSEAVIEFNMDGTVITANENFLNALGYSLHEIQGRHHSIFVAPADSGSEDYRAFWKSLRDGCYQAGEYLRLGKGGREVWIQASYNPILDLNGKAFKVVKYASDVTAQVIARRKSEHVRGMMESVAAGAEELNASVQEISSAMSKSRETTMTAVGHVEGGGQAGATPDRSGSIDERDRADDSRDHRPDQSAGAQRNDRVGSRRRGGAGLCGRGGRGEESCQSGKAGDRQDQPGDRKSQWNFERCGRGAENDPLSHPACQRVRDVNCRRGRRAERGHKGDVVEYAACGVRSGGAGLIGRAGLRRCLPLKAGEAERTH